MIEHRGLGGARRAGVVMAGDRVQKLDGNSAVELGSAVLDQPQPEMHVSEETALVRLPERRSGGAFRCAADVMKERRREHEIAAKPRMELRGLATDGCDADRMLEQAACVDMMGLGRRQPAECPAQGVVSEDVADDGW